MSDEQMNSTPDQSGQPDEQEKKKRQSRVIPRREADLVTIAAIVAESWKKHPLITLTWCTPDELLVSANTFGESYKERKDLKGSRHIITTAMNALDAEINVSAGHVKNYLSEIYSPKEARNFYPQFGFVRIKDTYRLPNDQDRRLFALGQMISAFDQHEMGERKFGKPYWVDIRSRFAEGKSEAVKNDSFSAEQVNIKTGEKAFIRRVLNALVFVIKGNFPDTWKEELRIWGFQKEKY